MNHTIGSMAFGVTLAGVSGLIFAFWDGLHGRPVSTELVALPAGMVIVGGGLSKFYFEQAVFSGNPE